MWKDFKDFINKGNLVALAVAFVMGATFSAVVTALVNNIIMPAVGLLLGDMDFNDLYAVIREPKDGAVPAGATLEQAQEAGAVVISYGVFVNAVIVFLVVALVLFFVVRGYNKLSKADEAVDSKDCPYCCVSIPIGATRCPNCTSELPAEAAEAAAG